MKLKIFIAAMIMIIALISCSDDIVQPVEPKTVQESRIEKRITEIIKGNIIKIEQEQEYGEENHIEVYIRSTAGSEVKVELFHKDLTLYEINGREASFEYEVFPGVPLINYSNAKQIANDNVTGVLKEWKLEKDSSDSNWQYRFFFTNNNGEVEIIIDAISGTIIEIKA